MAILPNGLETIELGATAWRIIINENFTKLDPLLAYQNPERTITVGASPFTYQNTNNYTVDIIISGGSVSLIEFSRDGTNWYDVGFTSGIVRLSPGDSVRVTYTSAPTMVEVPR